MHRLRRERGLGSRRGRSEAGTHWRAFHATVEFGLETVEKLTEPHFARHKVLVARGNRSDQR